MLKKSVAAATVAAFLASAAVAGARPGDSIPSVQSRPSVQGVQLAQNDTQGSTQAAVPADGRADPKTKKKKRRFFGLPLWGLGALAASGAGVAALDNGRSGISP